MKNSVNSQYQKPKPLKLKHMKKSLLVLSGILLCITAGYSQASFNTGAMQVFVNQYGRIRLFTADGVKQLERASILVGVSPTEVFDYTNDAESLDPTVLVSNPAVSDSEIYGSVNNAYSSLPPDVTVKYNAYGWNTKGYTIVKFTIKNNEVGEMNASAGLDIIPNINEEYGFDTVTYNSGEGVIRFHRGPQQNIGIKLLSTSLSSLISFEWYDGYSADGDYWAWMNSGSLQSQYASATADGPVSITSQAPVVLAPGESFEVFYALALGANEQTMLSNISEAVQKYESTFASVADNGHSVSAFNLGNFPNPFNSSTTISYQLPGEGFASLKIYNAFGKEIATLVNSKQTIGSHVIPYNASDLTSGVYFYTLRYNDKVESKSFVVK